MHFTKILSTAISTILLISVMSGANAAGTAQKRVLSDQEKQRIAAEFNQHFRATDSGSYQKLNNNPWASKKAKQKRHAEKMLRLSGSMDSCQQFALKQRNQCYAVGNDGSICELYYKARVGHCAEYF
ncbi:MAG: hypothetical protein OQL06_08145 [Gammaproteobacteria bacterium]|nr:hypothetical protein [Gammaproteobacteria bacterium]